MTENTKPFSGLKILVVDDDPAGLELILTLLKHHGASSIGATNGAEGLAFARELKPNFIISDLSMPVMNGWQMINELKQDRQTMEIPIIALTAHAMRGDREKAIAAGCHNYLSKPIDPYNFATLLNTILDEIPELNRGLSAAEIKQDELKQEDAKQHEISEYKQGTTVVVEMKQDEPKQEDNANPNR